jgi:hypothetical protein
MRWEGQTGEQTARHDEASSRFCNCANSPKTAFLFTYSLIWLQILVQHGPRNGYHKGYLSVQLCSHIPNELINNPAQLHYTPVHTCLSFIFLPFLLPLLIPSSIFSFISIYFSFFFIFYIVSYVSFFRCIIFFLVTRAYFSSPKPGLRYVCSMSATRMLSLGYAMHWSTA